MNTTILIVEDEGLIALSLKSRLERAGYTVPAMADNGAEALRAVERLRPSLVLMDIQLKGELDGVETAGLIRSRYDVPVMFMTSHADPETLERARITEPFGYFVKPVHGDIRAQIEMGLWKHGTEQKLRASEAWLSATVRNVADALIATDGEGNIAFMNEPAAVLTGWDCEEARGRPFLEVVQVFDETTGEPEVHPLEVLYDGGDLSGAPRVFRLFRRGGGDSAVVEATLSANRDGATLLGIVAVFRDLTERRRTEEALRRLQKMNSLVLLSVGLGNELAEAQRAIDAALGELTAKAEGRAGRLLAKIYERCAFQKSLLHQLIALGKTDGGETVAVDLNSVIAEMEPALRESVGADRRVILKQGDGVPNIRVNPRELRANLLRLALNARNAMPDGGVVEVSTGPLVDEGGTKGASLAIRDSGKGIPAFARERVFEPYFESRAGSRNPALSLALVHQFMAVSGGTIEVSSEPGEGTTFRLCFPAAAANAA